MKLRQFVERRGTIILFIFIVILFLSYTYDDMVITQRHSLFVWDAFSKGQLTNFYQFCYDNQFGGAVYDMTIYFIFAIWNLPCWIFEKATGLNAQDFELWITYGKGIVFIAYFYSVKLFATIYRKICDRFSQSDMPSVSVKSATIYYASSMLLLCYSVFSGNYDIISLVLMLVGINALLDNKKILFLLVFCIATSLKFFAAWIFVPLLLLNEKRITRIIPSFLFCFSLSVIEGMIFNKSSILASNTSAEWFRADSGVASLAHAGEFTGVGLGRGTPVSLCVLLYILLCVYCYLQKKDDSALFVRKIFFSCTAAWLIFFIFCGFNCYWIVLLIPFMALLVLTNKQDLYINIILESFFSLSIFVNCQMLQGWVLGNLFKHGLLKELLSVFVGNERIIKSGALTGLIEKYTASFPLDIFVVTIALAMAIALLIINYPGEKRIKITGDKDVVLHDYFNCLLIRNGFNYLVVCLPILCYIFLVIFR